MPLGNILKIQMSIEKLDKSEEKTRVSEGYKRGIEGQDRISRRLENEKKTCNVLRTLRHLTNVNHQAFNPTSSRNSAAITSLPYLNAK